VSCRNTVVDLGDVYDETGFLRDMDREGTARDVVGAPANDQCVVSLLRRRVRHLVGGRSLFLYRQVVH